MLLVICLRVVCCSLCDARCVLSRIGCCFVMLSVVDGCMMLVGLMSVDGVAVVCCSLLVAGCLLVVHRRRCVVSSLCVVCRLLRVALCWRYLFWIVYYSVLYVVCRCRCRCSLLFVRCSLLLACCLLIVACCSLFVDCCLFRVFVGVW